MSSTSNSPPPNNRQVSSRYSLALSNARSSRCAPPMSHSLFLFIYIIARLTRLTHQTLALTCDYHTVDPSALVLSPTFSKLHALPNSPVATIMTALALLRLARPTCSTRKLNRSPAPPRIYLPRKYRPPLQTQYGNHVPVTFSAIHVVPRLYSPHFL
jgi:hypothetical protein